MRKYRNAKELVDLMYRWSDSPFLAERLRHAATLLEPVDKFASKLLTDGADNLDGMYNDMNELSSMLLLTQNDLDTLKKKPPPKDGG